MLNPYCERRTRFIPRYKGTDFFQILQEINVKSKVVGAVFMDNLSVCRNTEQTSGVFC